MRYLIQTCFSKEITSRKSFLYDSLKLWFYVTETAGSFVHLQSMPTNYYSDWIILVGHNSAVKEYLTTQNFYEKNIVAITCDGDCNFKRIRLPNKNLYIPFQNQDNLVDLLSGEEFGFHFDLTESELLFFNSPSFWSIEKRIEQSFQPISKYRRNKT